MIDKKYKYVLLETDYTRLAEIGITKDNIKNTKIQLDDDNQNIMIIDCTNADIYLNDNKKYQLIKARYNWVTHRLWSEIEVFIHKSIENITNDLVLKD